MKSVIEIQDHRKDNSQKGMPKASLQVGMLLLLDLALVPKPVPFVEIHQIVHLHMHPSLFTLESKQILLQKLYWIIALKI